MANGKQPLSEVFGYLINDQSESAKRYRSKRLCPFNNKVPNCTKDKAENPLGVCSVFYGDEPVITCPIRFRENWIITDDAGSFFFPDDAKWSSLTEVRLNDAEGKSAGNIDVVLVAYNEKGIIYDFGALEIQAVYISGNIRNPFEYYMTNPLKNSEMDWSSRPNYPRPDYLSSSRKRLAPQLLFKGGILKAWNKRTAVALNKGFYETLPKLKGIPKEEADIAWFVYDLKLEDDRGEKKYKLHKIDEIFTEFEPSLIKITTSMPGKLEDFIKLLQNKLDEQMELPPNNRLIEKPL